LHSCVDNNPLVKNVVQNVDGTCARCGALKWHRNRLRKGTATIQLGLRGNDTQSVAGFGVIVTINNIAEAVEAFGAGLLTVIRLGVVDGTALKDLNVGGVRVGIHRQQSLQGPVPTASAPRRSRRAWAS